MKDLKEWEFPFPQGTEHRQRLEKKRLEYFRRLDQVNGHGPDKTDLVTRFNDGNGDDSDFRLRYLKFVVLSRIMIATERTVDEERSGPAVVGREIISDLSPIFRIYQYPDEVSSAFRVVTDYVSGKEPLDLEGERKTPEPLDPAR